MTAMPAYAESFTGSAVCLEIGEDGSAPFGDEITFQGLATPAF